MATSKNSLDINLPTGEFVENEPTPAEIEAASQPALAGFNKAPPASVPTKNSLDINLPTGGPPEPTLGGLAASAFQGAVKGGFRDPPVLGGALAGFRVGMPLAAAAAPFIGPFAGAIPLATTALGGYLGYEAGQSASGIIPGEDDPRLKPYFEGGTTFGSALLTAPFTFGLPIAGPTAGRVATYLSTMGEVARRNPKVFMGTEAVTAGSTGVAGGAAEAYSPGQEGVRLAAELAAGVAPVGKLFTLGVDASKSALGAAEAAYSGRSASTEKKAANLLFDILTKHGEKPEALIKALRQQLPGTVPTPTSGQKTGSPALMELERSLATHRAEFGGEIKTQGDTAMLAYQALIEALGKTGPEGLKVASKLRYDRFVNGLQTRLDLANADAARKIAKISKDTPEARQEIGRIVKDSTEEALIEARKVESELWTKTLKEMTKPFKATVQREVEVGLNQTTRPPWTRKFDQVVNLAPAIPPSNTVNTFLIRASEMGPALFDNISPQVRKIMDSFGVNEESVKLFREGKLTDAYLTTGEMPISVYQGKGVRSPGMPTVKDQPVQDLVSYRSELLNMARDAAATPGQRSNADFYSRLADGMMRDLDTLQDPMYDQARAFSRALNDTFTRTFAGTAGAVAKTGQERIPAEVLVQRAFSGGADQTAMRMVEIEDAVGFMRTQYRDAVAQFGFDSPRALELKPLAVAATGNVASIRDAHNRILRLAAAKSIKDVNGVPTLNYGNLSTFIKENAPLLEKMGLMGDLRDAAHAANLLTQVTKETSVLSRTADSQRAFAKLLTAESPSKVIADSLNGRFPVRDIRELADLAKKGGPDAVEGFKSSLYDYAYTKAGGNSPNVGTTFSVDAYAAALFDPISRNQPSIANIMRANGMLTLQELLNFKKLLVPMARIETSIKNNLPVENLIQGADIVTDLGLRILGSRAGTAASAGAGGGAPIIAAAAGSKALRQIFDALPNATVRAVFENAIKDPEAMALLLAKGRTEKEKTEIANRFIRFLGSLGVSVGKSAVTPALNYLNAQEEKPPQTSPFTPEGAAARQLRQLPTAPSTRGVPGLTDTAPKPPGQSSSGAPPNASARSMFQSLFPFDTVSQMAGAQAQQLPRQ